MNCEIYTSIFDKPMMCLSIGDVVLMVSVTVFLISFFVVAMFALLKR